MSRSTQHWDVGSSAEDAIDCTSDLYNFDFGVLEADALDGVGKFDVDTKVVGVQFEFVAFFERELILHVHIEFGDFAVERELPMLVLIGGGVELNHGDVRVGTPEGRGVLAWILSQDKQYKS